MAFCIPHSEIRNPKFYLGLSIAVIIILMGVSGCGKTTVGKLLSSVMHLPFVDADDLHPPENVLKMSQGIPLDDNDRVPWLHILKDRLGEMRMKRGGIVACSALKADYRKILRAGAGPDAQIVFLKGSHDLLLKRLKQRQGHYMKEGLLDSQFRDLEEPEDALILSIEASPEAICRQILENIGNISL